MILSYNLYRLKSLPEKSKVLLICSDPFKLTKFQEIYKKQAEHLGHSVIFKTYEDFKKENQQLKGSDFKFVEGV
jgi:hypothetical protein